ncbi:MAG: hypothetical protein CME38_01950 [Haliea sp.]|nr:hypothetical protein [Haliea sp.]
MPASSTAFCALRVLTWIDPRPRLAWCGLCLLLLLALLEIAQRGYLTVSLLGFAAWSPLAWLGLPAVPAQQRLALGQADLRWWPAQDREAIDLHPLPGCLLLPGLVVLRAAPAAGGAVQILWVWRQDVDRAGFRHLRRWLIAADLC